MSRSSENSHSRLADLCMSKVSDDGKNWLPIEDDAFEEISDLLLNVGHRESWSRRPRTYAVLRMMNAVSHMDAFETHGLNDTSFPYRSKRDLPPELQSPDMSEKFLWYQKYVFCDICDLEKDKEGRHISVTDGEKMFRWIKKLGKGQSGDVDKVESRMTGTVYARKRIKRHREMRKEKDAFKQFETELAALKRLDHEHLVRVLGSYTDDRYVALLMSPVADYNLKTYLRDQIKKGEMPTFRQWYGCLANAIAYLKDMEIRHKDIKPENILVKGKDIFLSDFGTAWDWSDSKFADSVTKGTLDAYTPRYASPEVMTTGPKSRRSSSDVWSLGIVFLEMTTVLRGKTLKDYEMFLSRNGTKSSVPSGNWVAVNSWLEELIPHFPRTDNEPLQWIKEMIKIDPTTRPKPRDLSTQIGQAMNGVWCGRCCNDGESTESITTSEYEIRHGDIAEEAEEVKVHDAGFDPTLIVGQKTSVGFSSPISSAPDGLITDKQIPIIRHSVLETPLSPGETMGDRMMNTFLNSLDEADVPTSSRVGMSQPLPTLEEMVQPIFIEIHPAASEDILKNSRKIATDGAVSDLPPIQKESQSVKECVKKSSGRSDATRATATVETVSRNLLSNIQTQAIASVAVPGLNKSNFSTELNSTKKLDCGEIKTYHERNKVCEIDVARTEGTSILGRLQKSAEKKLIPEMIRSVWKDWAHLGIKLERQKNGGRQSLFRTRSYEDICRATETLLESQPFYQQGSERRASDDFFLMQYLGDKMDDFSKIKNELKQFKPVVTSSLPEACGTIIESAENVHTKKTEKWMSFEAMAQDFSAPETPPPVYTEVRDPATEPATRNSLKDALNQARGRFPVAPHSLLTAQNLISLNTESTKPEIIRVDLRTASAYMKKVHDDAASSVATSMMSTRTRERFKIAGLMLPLQDRSYRYMEQYCREGKVDAVRVLLKSGCEPGTVQRRRPGPIFHAVRGATMRHIKCVDALIAKGVNINVKSQSNGRTPLHYAIEHEEWPGYKRLLYTLLKAGADPNVKDATGDVPLLQILYGGIEPLEEHKRDALAILLTNNFKTNLAISAPATKNTPLHLAVLHRDPWAVALLLNRDVAVDKRNVAELTPFQLAAGAWSNPLSEDQMSILEMLLEKNANTNVKDERTGQTPVHTAVFHELHRVLRKLIASGGDINQRDRSGRSALDLFEEQKVKHAASRVCKKCAKVQHVMNKTLYQGAATSSEVSAGTRRTQQHGVLFPGGSSVSR